MKIKVLNGAIAGLILSISCLVNVANAGVIDLVDVDINLDSTNQGFTLSTNNYNLTWMDFGAYNGTSFSDMNNLINGPLSDWRYATYEESMHLFSVIFSEYLVRPEFYHLEVTLDDRSVLQFSNLLTGIIGVNSSTSSPASWDANLTNTFTDSIGVITDGTEVFGTMILSGISECAGYCATGGFIQKSPSIPEGNPTTSYMIVKDTVNVPEPSTLAIFVLGITGLVSRRFKKQSLNS